MGKREPNDGSKRSTVCSTCAGTGKVSKPVQRVIRFDDGKTETTTQYVDQPCDGPCGGLLDPDA